MHAASLDQVDQPLKTFLSFVFDRVETGIMLTDIKGHVLEANPFFLSVIGFSRHDIVGKPAGRLLPSPGTYTTRQGQAVTIDEAFCDDTGSRLSALDAAGEVRDWQTFYLDKSGRLVPALQTACLLKDARGAAFAVLYLVNDISEKQHLETELARATRLAESAAELKELFLAKITNEVRVPMDGICGFAELLIENESMTEEYKEQLQVIRQSSQDLLCLVNNVIDCAKLAAGKTEIADIAFDVELLFYNIIMDTRSRLSGGAVRLQYEISNQVPVLLKGDPSRIRQIMRKLLDNAIRFTPSGTIKVVLDVASENEADIQVRVQVKDTGIGITPEELGELFNLPDRQSGAGAKSPQGLGLGLHLCRSIARLMRGDLRAASQPGRGSCFDLTLVLNRAEKGQAARPSATVNLEGKTAFILDFDKIHLGIVSKLCRQADMHVVSCGSLHAMPEIFEDLIISKARVDLFIIDVSTLFEDIADIIELIRENFGPRVPLLAFTSPNRGSARTCQILGFNGCLSKPATRVSFYEIIRHLLTEEFDAAGAREILTRYSLSEQIKHNLNILVVDDNRVNQMVAAKILTQSGYTVDSARDGLEATNKILADPLKYDIILMDIQMPVMNGVDATIKLRQHNIKTPIIAYTANALKQDFERERYIQAGMNDLIPKPLNREIILEKFYDLCFSPESRTNPGLLN